mgnify:CR=1 FL=1
MHAYVFLMGYYRQRLLFNDGQATLVYGGSQFEHQCGVFFEGIAHHHYIGTSLAAKGSLFWGAYATAHNKWQVNVLANGGSSWHSLKFLVGSTRPPLHLTTTHTTP